MTEEVTNGELMRAIGLLRDEMNRRFAEATSKAVNSDLFEEYRRSAGQRTGTIEADLAEIKGRSARTFQLVLASFILPLLVGLIMAALVARGGI